MSEAITGVIAGGALVFIGVIFGASIVKATYEKTFTMYRDKVTVEIADKDKVVDMNSLKKE